MPHDIKALNDPQSLIGRRVNYSGDVCNAPRTGTVTDINKSQFGTDALITWDDEDAIGWDRDGHAVEFKQATSSIAIRSLFDTTAGARFSLVEHTVN